MLLEVERKLTAASDKPKVIQGVNDDFFNRNFFGANLDCFLFQVSGHFFCLGAAAPTVSGPMVKFFRLGDDFSGPMASFSFAADATLLAAYIFRFGADFSRLGG